MMSNKSHSPFLTAQETSAPAEQETSAPAEQETAAYLRISRVTVYRLAEAGRIPAVRIGRTWRFHRRLLDEWLESQMRGNLTR